MPSPRWFWNRLLAMTPSELPYRAWQGALSFVEGHSATGWLGPPSSRLPDIASALGDGLLAGTTRGRPLDDDAAVPVIDSAQAILDGSLFLFGRRRAAPPPIEWHADPISGRHWPRSKANRIDYRAGNAREIWEVGRLHHVATLAQAYRLTGRAEFADRAVADTVSFIRENPPLHGVHWCSALEVALRLVAWAWLWECTSEATQWTQASVRELATAVWYHAEFVRRHPSLFSSANNHLIGEASGLVCAGLAFGGLPGSQRWLALGATTLEREIVKQTSAEGGTREQAWRYAVLVLELAVMAGASCRAHGRPLSDGFDGRLQKVVEFLRLVAGSTNVVPHIGDADDAHAPGAYSGAMAAEPSLRAAESYLYGETVEGNTSIPAWGIWASAVPRRQSPVSPSLVVRRGLHVAKDAGYVVGVHGWGSGGGVLRVIFDVGPLGYRPLSAHGHADALSVWARVGDREFFRDSGTYTYTNDPEARCFLRGTAAHNTILVCDADQSVQSGPTLWASQATARLERHATYPWGWTAVGSHDGYVGSLGVSHERRVCLVEELGIVVVDRLRSLRRSSLPCFSLMWHLGESIEASEYGATFRMHDPDIEAQFFTTCLTSQDLHREIVRGRRNPMQGWESSSYGEIHAAPTFIATAEGGREALLVTALLIFNGASLPIDRLTCSSGELVWEQRDGRKGCIHLDTDALPTMELQSPADQSVAYSVAPQEPV